MRKYQLTIKLDCYDKQNLVNTYARKEIGVYADANSVWEVICCGFSNLIGQLTANGFSLPEFGRADLSVKDDEP